MGGTASQLITNSHTGLYHMAYFPAESFRCGPMALLRIIKYRAAQPSPMALRVLERSDQSPSTDHGLSLSAVEQIANRVGMSYQMAFRTAGSAVILPAVANWKVGHYAAIVDRRNDGRYLVQDTTFGGDILVSPSTLDEEASGYFLVPAGACRQGGALLIRPRDPRCGDAATVALLMILVGPVAMQHLLSPRAAVASAV